MYSLSLRMLKGTESVKIDIMFKIYFIDLNEARRIQLQFVINRFKIGPLEPEIQPAKGARRHRPLPSVTISLITLYNCFLTVEYYTNETQEISGAQLPYRRRESSIAPHI